MPKEFSKKQINALIKIKNVLVEEGFTIYYPKHKNHPEEVIAVSEEKNIVVDIITGLHGTIFLQCREQRQDELKKLLEKKTGVELCCSLITGGPPWIEEVEEKYSE